MGEINSNKKAILITGTIVPNSVFVAHTNVEQRKQEYIEGLLFYKAQFPNDDIFFLENSTHDFTTDSQFSDLFKKHHITLIKFPVSTKSKEGKGYQEFEMLDASIERLKNSYNYFVKVTGRYKVLNIKYADEWKTAEIITEENKQPYTSGRSISDILDQIRPFVPNMQRLFAELLDE